MYKKFGFTLLELMIVVVIMGIIAVFALPNYDKAIQRAQERAAVYNLSLLQEKIRLYLINNDTTEILDATNLDEINENYKIYLTDTNEFTYICDNDNGSETNVCSAQSPDGWLIHFHADSSLSQVIHCLSTTACPSCTNTHIDNEGGCSHLLE